MTSLLRILFLALTFVQMAVLPNAARADTVASLLGDFTINQYTGLELAGGDVKLHYVAVFGQLPALRELREADANADGITSQAERDAHVQKLAPGIAEQLVLSIGGEPVPLRAVRWTSSLPTEQGGFSMRLEIDFEGTLPATANPADQPQALAFENRNYPGKIGWHEIAVAAGPGIAVFDTNAFANSLTAGLTEALKELPASGPLDERAVQLKFARGAAPAGAQPIQARVGTVAAAMAAASAGVAPGMDGSTSNSTANGTAPSSAGSPWLQMQTRRLIEIISAPNVPPHILVIALLAAMVLGALHAFAPGHGKTVVGAYLVGSRGTPRHAVFLGVTVTITHTLIVFALGLVTLFASRFILPEKVFPILSLLSGLLVFGMGIVLLAQRWRGFAGAHGHSHPHPHEHAHENSHDGHGHGNGNGNGHQHAHGDHGQHGHSHSHAADAALMHSHGGVMHSHLPPVTPAEAVSWRGLLALGVSGGLLPCPSAMVLLLAAVALHKTFYGLLLVVAFSIGLALTLTAVGLAFLYARNRFAGSLGDARWVQVLPVLSAALITGLGAVLCYGALAAGPA